MLSLPVLRQAGPEERWVDQPASLHCWGKTRRGRKSSVGTVSHLRVRALVSCWGTLGRESDQITVSLHERIHSHKHTNQQRDRKV